jgi:hypothetical protein
MDARWEYARRAPRGRDTSVDQKSLRDLLQLRDEMDPLRKLRDMGLQKRVQDHDAVRRLMEETARAARPAYLEDAIRNLEKQNALTRAHDTDLAVRFEALRAGIPPRDASALYGEVEAAVRRMADIERARTQARRYIELQEGHAGSLAAALRASAGVAQRIDAARIAELVAIKAPWVDATAPTRSFESVAALAALGSSLRLPSLELQSDAIRKALGDWRGVSIPETILLDWDVRRSFYVHHGFDTRLTELPEPAFIESMRRTSVWRPDLSLPIAPVAQVEIENAEQAVEERMTQAFGLIRNIERQVRVYIERVMTERYGRNWVKQRVPAETLAAWRDKRKRESEEGRRVRPLIEYADFTDYLDIMIRRDNWADVFAPVFKTKDEVTVSFRRLFPLRICTMHGREITKEDYLVLVVETRWLLQAIGAIPPTPEGNEGM